MADDYGLTDAGFVPMALPEITDDLAQQMRLQFGNVDLSDQSVFGQLIGIFAASSAQLWQAGSALYASSFPGGATGVAVDNVLALANMQRLPAAATVTNPTPVTQTNGVILYGLRLLGTAGTVVPAGTLLSNGSGLNFSLDAGVTIAPANNARQTVYFNNVPTSGSYSLTLTSPTGAQATTPSMPYTATARVTTLRWAAAPSGSYTLTLGSATTQSIAQGASAAQVQAAINALSGYAGVSVTGSVTGGMALTWPAGYVPLVTASGAGAPTSIAHAIAAYVHALTSNGKQPFTDVLVSDGSQSTTYDFGAFAPQSNQASTGAAAVPRIVVANTTLALGGAPTVVAPQIVVIGAPAQGIGTATATSTGPQTVLAGQLSSVATPLSGLNSVYNDLDCLTGRDVETDADALTRFSTQLGATSSGSLGAIIKRVQQVDGVTQVVGFQNVGNAAGQVLLFASPPSTGQFSLLLNGRTTALLPYSASAADVQTAIRNLDGLGAVLVTAYGQNGYQLDLTAVRGGQALALAAVAQNTTGVTLTPYFARPPHSVEVVVEGGADNDVAQAILAALPAGIATYSNPVLRTTATLTAKSQTVTLAAATGVAVGQSVEAAGVPLGAQVQGLTENVATLSVAATQTASNVPISFDYAPNLKDAGGNVVAIGFSRPVSRLIYVQLNLTTDLLVQPGVSGSGSNSSATFSLSSVAGIQQGLIDLINAVPIGGQIIANGYNSLGGSFRSVPGIVDYDLYFGTSPTPTNQDNLTLQSNEAPTAQSYSVSITYT